MSIHTITRKAFLTNALPCLMASLLPNWLPIILATIMASPRGQLIWPKLANMRIAAKLVATFTNLVAAEACKKSKPKKQSLQRKM
jgi:hypothetical protein